MAAREQSQVWERRGLARAVRVGRRGLAVLALLLALSAALPMAASAQTLADARTTVTAADALEGPLLAKINDVRRARGLQPLVLSKSLSRATDAHARAMARGGFFSHDSADGTSAIGRIKRFYSVEGYRSWALGENLLWRSPGVTPAQALQMWLTSPPHRRVLLEPDFREIGLAAVHATRAPGDFRSLDVTIVVADFGART